ncbi:hypothetical protein [Treponema putidum]|uniref:hypothetical protein n=1 Tax=Treponema putidum TaxID=221027 RepID=UPI0021023208|nr:hypothetical protein [Treponema putidum]UTY30466.1 hypothetical protein E4N75_02085 [Treponema putidum]
MKRKEKVLNGYDIVTFCISKELHTLLKESSLVERKTKSDIIRDALTLYLTQGINDKELVYASLNDSKRRIGYIDKKIEAFFNYFHFALTTIFAGIPDISIHSKEEQEVITKNALRRRNAMFEAYKKNMKDTPSFLQMVLSDFIEHENTIRDKK